jgi:hypothetical protein
MDKIVRDGMVAVLVSPGFGAGWYTWNKEMPELLFDPTLVDLVLSGAESEELVAYADLKYPEGYTGGAGDLIVKWVPEGAQFRIDEYDGSESLVLESEEVWITA